MSEPRTAAGRRLHARIFGLSDRMPDGAELDNLILAIEAEAAAPASPDAVALRRAWGRAVRAADTETRYWLENIYTEEAAALPADKPAPSVQAQPAGLDVERLEAAYDRHFDAPDHYDECGSACFQTFMAAYAAADPDAKEAHEVFNQHLDIEHLAARPADKPEPSVQAEPAGLDVERLARAIRIVRDSDPAEWLERGDEADAIAAAYAEGKP